MEGLGVYCDLKNVCRLISATNTISYISMYLMYKKAEFFVCAQIFRIGFSFFVVSLQKVRDERKCFKILYFVVRDQHLDRILLRALFRFGCCFVIITGAGTIAC